MATDLQIGNATSEGRADVATAAPARPAAPWNTTSRGAWWVRAAIAVCLIAGVAAAASFLLGGATPEASVPKLLQTLARRDLDVMVTEEGTLESANNTEVRCKVRGANSTVVWIIENGTAVKPGDVLVKLDTSTIEDNINTKKISYQTALATYAQSESDVAVARINITEYMQGTYRSELKTKEKDVSFAKANLVTAQNILRYSRKIFQKGYISSMEVESHEFSLEQAELELEVAQTDLDVLQRYTKAKQTEELNGILKAKVAKFASDKAALELEKSRLEREEQQLENCVMRAEVGGMVIYAGTDKWEDRPDIREGATVREDQVLLLIPDLTDMQVKVGIHEAKVDQVTPGMPARVELQDKTFTGEVLSIASVAKPAGWWNGNMVKYNTIIKIETQPGLKPGMSANVAIFMARHKDVLTIPVAAVVEQEERFYCWLKTSTGLQRRELELGDSDDQFIVVQGGVREGDQVVINPRAYIDAAQAAALQPARVRKPQTQEADPSRVKQPSREPKQSKPTSAQTKTADNKAKSE